MDTVIFRKWRGYPHTVIALFPGDVFQGFVQSYEHIGQHGRADYGLVIRQTRPASPEDYADLAKELTEIGYDLRPMRRRQRH